MRWFFGAPKTYVKTDRLENIYNFTLNNFVYLILYIDILLTAGEFLDSVAPVPPWDVKELKPFTNYSIYVMGFNRQGAGLQSQTIVVQTKEDGNQPFCNYKPRYNTVISCLFVV